MTYTDRFEPRQALFLTLTIAPLTAAAMLSTAALFGFVV